MSHEPPSIDDLPLINLGVLGGSWLAVPRQAAQLLSFSKMH